MTGVQISDIRLSFGERELLQGVTYNLDQGKRAALTGSNGSGKTTLMKIIAGLERPDSGRVIASRDCRIAYLPQSGLAHRGRTLWEETELAFGAYSRLMEQKEALERRLADVRQDDSGLGTLLEEHHRLSESLLDSGYYSRDEAKESVLRGLGFSRQDFHRPAEEFSGGWQMRIALAKVLLENPDILLLDEPTNYLDLEARNWLESFLADFPGGVLLVSHDRYFLDVTVGEVAELFNGKLQIFKGNYSGYLRRREQELEELVKKYEHQQEEIARAEDLIRRFRYKATKAAMVQSRIKQLEKMDRIEIPESMKKIHFHFPSPPHSGNQVLQTEDLEKSYGDLLVFKGLNLELTRGERLVIAGKNGAGKSTLMRILSGEDRDYRGTIRLGANVKVGYFSQDHEESLTGENQVIQELEESAPTHLIPNLRNLLGAFLFRGDDIYKPVSVLSGGEKSRLSLLKLLLHPANLLILDEPTNHLDMYSKDVLLSALSNYSGTLIFVSHDRYFIEKLATKVLEMSGAGPRLFPGDYGYYLWKTGQELPEPASGASGAREGAGGTFRTGGADSIKNTKASPRPVAPNSPDSPNSPAAPVSPARKKLSREEEKKIKSEVQKKEREEQRLLDRLEELEAELDNLKDDLARPEVYSDPRAAGDTQKKIDGLQGELTDCHSRWENLDRELEELRSLRDG